MRAAAWAEKEGGAGGGPDKVLSVSDLPAGGIQQHWKLSKLGNQSWTLHCTKVILSPVVTVSRLVQAYIFSPQVQSHIYSL